MEAEIHENTYVSSPHQTPLSSSSPFLSSFVFYFLFVFPLVLLFTISSLVASSLSFSQAKSLRSSADRLDSWCLSKRSHTPRYRLLYVCWRIRRGKLHENSRRFCERMSEGKKERQNSKGEGRKQRRKETTRPLTLLLFSAFCPLLFWSRQEPQRKTA